MSGERRSGQKRVLARMGKFMSSSWHVPGDEAGNPSRRAMIAYNVVANVHANLVGGNFFTGLLIALQADDAFVGLVTMLTFGANLLQMFTPFLLERFTRRKPVLIAARILIHLVNVAFIGAIPYLPAAWQQRLVMLGFSVFLVNALGAFIGPGVAVWHIAHIPPQVRVQYFSMVTMLNGIFIALFNLLGSGVVDSFRSGGRELLGLTVLRVFAFVLAAVDIFLLTRIKELPAPKPAKPVRLRALLVEPWRHPDYLRSVLVILLWSFVANMPGSFYTVYLLRELGVSYSYIMAVNAFNVVVLTALTFAWRKVFLKHNWLKPLGVAVLAFAPHYVALSFVSRDLLFLYPVAIIWSFVCLSGINLAFSSVAFINIPQDNQTQYVGFFWTANFLGAFAAASLSRAFVTGFHTLRFTLLGVPFGEKQLLMLIVGFLMAGVGFAILRVAKTNIRKGLEH
ncbi:MAG TPA: MFS transporter [Candidatus Limnocylindria bacterium]|nr:MFS transporter [Candidatus Limnocylindria bacterium]